MTSKRIHSDASGSRRMAWMDWFGLIALGLLMVCSLVLLGQLLNLDMLDNKYLLLLMAGILILNSGHAVVQLPRRPSKGGHAAKIGCGVLAVILSAGMIYGAVAGGSLKSAVTRIVGKMAEKQTIDIIVLKDNEAKLHQLAQYLYDHETITGKEFMDILKEGESKALPEGD